MIANYITGIRIIGSIAMLLFPVRSVPFTVLYLLCGVTDMIDGTVARRTGTAGEFGARLDTAADFIMLAVCLYKLMPVLNITKWMVVWITVIALLKAVSFAIGLVRQGKPVMIHSALNKLTGVLLFLLPLMPLIPQIPMMPAQLIRFETYAAVVLAVATLAAIQEGILITKKSL